MNKPAIVTRREWGALPPRYGKSTLYDCTDEACLREVYNTCVIHHSGETNGVIPTLSFEGAKGLMRSYQMLHINNGWGDIGYHYVIAPGGQIFGGRTVYARGAHVAGKNTGKLGICLMGNFDVHPLPEAQQNSLFDAVRWYCKSLKIDTVRGHGYYGGTACPGKSLQALMGKLQKHIE